MGTRRYPLYTLLAEGSYKCSATTPHWTTDGSWRGKTIRSRCYRDLKITVKDRIDDGKQRRHVYNLICVAKGGEWKTAENAVQKTRKMGRILIGVLVQDGVSSGLFGCESRDGLSCLYGLDCALCRAFLVLHTLDYLSSSQNITRSGYEPLLPRLTPLRWFGWEWVWDVWNDWVPGGCSLALPSKRQVTVTVKGIKRKSCRGSCLTRTL